MPRSKTLFMKLTEIRVLQESDSWGEHPDFRRTDWKQEVSEGNTQLGYWDWVKHLVVSSYEPLS